MIAQQLPAFPRTQSSDPSTQARQLELPATLTPGDTAPWLAPMDTCTCVSYAHTDVYINENINLLKKSHKNM